MFKTTTTKTTIYQNQIGLLLKDGKIMQTLGAGTYRTKASRNETIIVYPTYRQSFTASYSIRTLEQAVVTLTMTMGVTVTEAVQLFAYGRTAYELVNQSIARQLQMTVHGKALGELLESDIVIDEDAINRELADSGVSFSLELAPRVQLPRNLQNAMDAQEVARQRAKAELEEARGRTAVIRHYANIAKVTRDNPDLLRLLLGQKAKSVNVAFDASEKTRT